MCTVYMQYLYKDIYIFTYAFISMYCLSLIVFSEVLVFGDTQFLVSSDLCFIYLPRPNPFIPEEPRQKTPADGGDYDGDVVGLYVNNNGI